MSGAARPTSVEAALARARARLAQRGGSPALDAEVLLAHVLGRSRAWLRAFGERELGAAEAARFEALVARSAA
ncbi:MAG: protein-(glutamine-N5) methyltransferase, release factor-specific, partial [Gammaproteobacteria bacterium]|nr:protein-(glutamine-N5) methyltransferase, release factor-specific [Gammaproteobacteria bacterium]